MMRRIHDPERGANFVEYAAIILLVAAIASTVLASGITDRPGRMIADALDSIGSDSPGEAGDPAQPLQGSDGGGTEPPALDTDAPQGGEQPGDTPASDSGEGPGEGDGPDDGRGEVVPPGLGFRIPGLGPAAPGTDRPLGLGDLGGITSSVLPGGGLLEPVGLRGLDDLPGHDFWADLPDLGYRQIAPFSGIGILGNLAEAAGGEDGPLGEILGFDDETGEILTGTLEGLANTVLHPVETGKSAWESLTGTIGEIEDDSEERQDDFERRWDQGRYFDAIRGHVWDTFWEASPSPGRLLVPEEAREHFRNGEYGRGAAQVAAAIGELLPQGRGLGAARRLPTPEPPERPGTGPQHLAEGQHPGDGEEPDGGGDGPACRPRNSFVPGTPVLLADGTAMPIEDVVVGDEVLAFDPLTGEEGPREVTDLISSAGAKTLVILAIDTGDDTTGTITATDAHPFWVPDRAEWVAAVDLEPGTWLRTSAGTWAQVTAVDTHTTDAQRVHNLTIADLHTYYVGDSAGSLLVHNQDGCRTGRVTFRANDLATESYEYRAGRHPDNSTPIAPNRNVSTFEYTDANGDTQTITRANDPGGRHAEEIIMDELDELGIADSDVTGIYSERVPCSQSGHDCGIQVGRYSNADISFTLGGSTSQNAQDISAYMRENGDR
ncbi:polymorphic toxin-type HINT domain-containing protein [Nocardiopsis sediminis]|uniref:Polymorphic toxin-type HINT domain-containing protein n=1 Tax=Nocardiopsis sediminis TaxID=1778267 RepID=A0ABV8FP84_9ACTN